jgi:hypothetical protein
MCVRTNWTFLQTREVDPGTLNNSVNDIRVGASNGSGGLGSRGGAVPENELDITDRGAHAKRKPDYRNGRFLGFSVIKSDSYKHITSLVSQSVVGVSGTGDQRRLVFAYMLYLQ